VLAAYADDTDSPELAPMVLCQACVAVLPVAGAGISLTDGLRVPLGASDEAVARAERLQTTLGEGPCLAATSTEEPVSADLARIAASWPLFHEGLMAQTPFRSVVSLPLRSRRRLRFGALDLYLTTPFVPSALSGGLFRQQISDPIGIVLFEAPRSVSLYGVPLWPWLDGPAARSRMQVWVAIGIVMEYARVSNGEALSVLRGYAFSHEGNLDDTADQVMSGTLKPEALFI